MSGDIMHKQGCGGNCGCHGRKHFTKDEKKERLQHRAECLGKELEGIKEALQELEK
jgi:hypothetical protein